MSRYVAVTITVSLLVSAFCISRYAQPISMLNQPGSTSSSGKLGPKTSAEPSVSLQPASAADVASRSGFLIKVYGTVMLQLMTTAVVAFVVASLMVPEEDSVFDREGNSMKHTIFDLANSTMGHCIAVVVTFGIITELVIWRKDPWLSLHLFEAFAVAMGYWTGIACAFVPRAVVAFTVALTFSIFALLSTLSLVISALGVDLGFWEPILTQCLNLVVWSAIMRLFLGQKKEAIWAVGGVCLFSAYIVFDSNRIARHYAADEYIAGALDLYLDVINLFLELLDLIAKGSK